MDHESATYFANYRDGKGYVCETATSCRDEAAARVVLTGLEKRAEKVLSGIITSAEDAMSSHPHAALTKHLAEFIATTQAAGRAESDTTGTERLIQRAIDELSLRRLSLCTLLDRPPTSSTRLTHLPAEQQNPLAVR